MRVLILLAAVVAVVSAADYRPPAGIRPTARRPGAESVLPGGRMISPMGRQFATGPGAFSVAVSPDGKFAVTANGGPNKYSLSVLDMTSEPWQIRQLVALQKDD